MKQTKTKTTVGRPRHRPDAQALAMLRERYSTKQIAHMFDVEPKTIYIWEWRNKTQDEKIPADKLHHSKRPERNDLILLLQQQSIQTTAESLHVCIQTIYRWIESYAITDREKNSFYRKSEHHFVSLETWIDIQLAKYYNVHFTWTEERT